MSFEDVTRQKLVVEGRTEMSFWRLTKEQYAWVGLRLVLGWTLLFAFLTQMFGLGFGTEPGQAWINGVSPTEGFLKYASAGPLHDFYSSIAGNVAVDVLWMLALVAIGGALMLGIGQRISGYAGALLMILLWSSRLPPSNNPLVDEHIVYLFGFLLIAFVRPGKWMGLGKWWSNTSLVMKHPILE